MLVDAGVGYNKNRSACMGHITEIWSVRPNATKWLKNCKINNLTQHILHLDKSKTTNWCTLSFIITISILLTRVWGIWTIVITLKQRHVELCNQSTQDFLFKRFGRNEKKEIKTFIVSGWKGVFVKLRQGSGKDRQGMAPKAKGLKA